MPSLLGREVCSYRVSVFESTNLDYDRWIRLELGPQGDEPRHVVEIEFPPVAPADFLYIGAASSLVRIDRNKFDAVVRLLQTERPLFFNARDADDACFAGLSTDPGFTGESAPDADFVV